MSVETILIVIVLVLVAAMFLKLTKSAIKLILAVGIIALIVVKLLPMVSGL